MINFVINSFHSNTKDECHHKLTSRPVNRSHVNFKYLNNKQVTKNIPWNFACQELASRMQWAVKHGWDQIPISIMNIQGDKPLF
jgi:hypothetical protein